MIKNTAYSYGSIAKVFHWLTALLFLISYCSVYYRHWFTEEKTPENWNALQIHLSIGLSIAVVVMLRIIWRNMNRQPEHAPGTQFEHYAASAGHYVLYAVMIIMPLTGYLGTGVNTEFFFLFDIPKFSDTALYNALITQGLAIDFEAFEAPIDFIHKKSGEYLVWVLILGHAAAALYHHFVKKDNTLRKMMRSS